MPSYRKKYTAKPWLARRKREGYEHFLGYYATEEEAAEVEAAFDSKWGQRCAS